VAGVLTKSAAPEPAAAFVRHITTSAAGAVFAATGVE
jgi:ABC-type Fe3+ transport system substrate-binding protein